MRAGPEIEASTDRTGVARERAVEPLRGLVVVEREPELALNLDRLLPLGWGRGGLLPERERGEREARLVGGGRLLLGGHGLPGSETGDQMRIRSKLTGNEIAGSKTPRDGPGPPACEQPWRSC